MKIMNHLRKMQDVLGKETLIAGLRIRVKINQIRILRRIKNLSEKKTEQTWWIADFIFFSLSILNDFFLLFLK